MVAVGQHALSETTLPTDINKRDPVLSSRHTSPKDSCIHYYVQYVVTQFHAMFKYKMKIIHFIKNQAITIERNSDNSFTEYNFVLRVSKNILSAFPKPSKVESKFSSSHCTHYETILRLMYFILFLQQAA